MLLNPSDVPESVEIQRHLTQIRIEEWLSNDLFHLEWWILIALVVILITSWLLILDKSRKKEICLYTLFATIFVLGISEYGEELILWEYPTEVIPIFPALFSVNLVLIPISFSLVYQFCRKQRDYLVASIIAAAVISFIVEPILCLGDLYLLINWSYFYNFPLYVLLAFFVKYATNKVLSITKKAKAAAMQPNM